MIDITRIDDPNSQPYDVVRFKATLWPETRRALDRAQIMTVINAMGKQKEGTNEGGGSEPI